MRARKPAFGTDAIAISGYLGRQTGRAIRHWAIRRADRAPVSRRASARCPRDRAQSSAQPSLSRDGKWAIVQTQGSPSQLRLLPTGPGEARDLTKDTINHNTARWFPDGKRVLFSGNEPDKGVRLYVLDVESGKTTPITPEGVHGNAFVISPDSQFVAGVGPDQKGYMYPVQGGDPRPVSGLEAGEQPVTWSTDGRSCISTNRESCRPRFIAWTCKLANARFGNS